VLEALFVQCQMNPEHLARGIVKFTREQLRDDVLKARHPRKPPTFTLQALSTKYLPRFVSRPDVGKPASVLELLIRTDKGHYGKASTYKLTPLMQSLLLIGQARPPAPRPDGGHPEARPEAPGSPPAPGPSRPTGPGAAKGTPRASEGANETPELFDPLAELPEDDDPSPVLATPEPDDPLAQLPDDED
jgi:hypothetical protein